MQTENDNGKQPAFPIVNSEGFPSSKGAIDLVNNSLCIGLTKREYFAAMAMQGFCASGIGTDPNIHRQMAKKGIDPADENNVAEAIAIFSVACADELLKQLNK